TVDLRQDGRIQASGGAQTVERLRGLVPLNDRFAVADQIFDTLAFTEPLAELAIAAPATMAGRHKVSKATESIKRFRPRPQGGADTHHLRQCAREHRRLGVISQLQTVTAARSDRIHVFEAAPKFSPGQVMTRVNPQRRAAQG